MTNDNDKLRRLRQQIWWKHEDFVKSIDRLLAEHPSPAPAAAPSESVREELAALEHDQWVAWSKSLAQNEIVSKDCVERWQTLWVPYGELSEKLKDLDRKWADKGLSIMRRAAPASSPPVTPDDSGVKVALSKASRRVHAQQEVIENLLTKQGALRHRIKRLQSYIAKIKAITQQDAALPSKQGLAGSTPADGSAREEQQDARPGPNGEVAGSSPAARSISDVLDEALAADAKEQPK